MVNLGNDWDEILKDEFQKDVEIFLPWRIRFDKIF